MDGEFSLVGELLQNSVQYFHEFQKPGNQHNLFPIAPNATSFQQEKSAQLLIFIQEIEHHLDRHLKLLARRADAFCGQSQRRIDLVPAVLENRLQNALFVPKMFYELRLAGTRKPTDGSR